MVIYSSSYFFLVSYFIVKKINTFPKKIVVNLTIITFTNDHIFYSMEVAIINVWAQGLAKKTNLLYHLDIKDNTTQTIFFVFQVKHTGERMLKCKFLLTDLEGEFVENDILS